MNDWLRGTLFLFFVTTSAIAQPSDSVSLAITDQGCAPKQIVVPSGIVSFNLSNDSSKSIEWEIVQGVKVIFEREHILPGFKLNLRPRLEPGDYQMTCGLLSNPKGRLIVQGDALKPGKESSLPPYLEQLMVAYRRYTLEQAHQLQEKTRLFVEAIQRGQLEVAQKLYPLARRHYEHIEPAVDLFSDLDASMDARADNFEHREADPNFRGFHRLEKSLFQDKTTTGLAAIADRLLADVQELEKRLSIVDLPPGKIIAGAAVLMEEITAAKISGEENRYSGMDFYDIQANMDGAAKIVELVREPLLNKDPLMAERIETGFHKVQKILEKYKNGESEFKLYSTLSQQDKNALKAGVTTLAEELSRLGGVLNL